MHWVTNGPAVYEAPTEDARSNRFHHFLQGSLNEIVWTNILARTNGRGPVLWSVREHPQGWPATPPIVRWNTNSLIWGMKGLTGLSPCWEDEGAPGQAPITAITRRHGYTRGHSMGAEGIASARTGKRVWFLTTNNVVIEARIQLAFIRLSGARDYTLLLFSNDLPASIEPLRVESGTNMMLRFPSRRGAPSPVIKVEQGGQIGLGLPGFDVNTWKPGDSGSPDLLAMGNELVFIGGRSTSSATPLMQKDLSILCRIGGLDSRKYELRWFDFSSFPIY